MSLKTYRLPPLSGGPPDSVVIFLHGLGDSGSGGLLDIGRIWQRILPHTEFLCPDAPFVFDMAPPDFGGRQWFSLREFTPQAIMSGVATATPLLNDYITEILSARALKPNRLALVGFSQGTIMALHVALRHTEPVAGIVGYSGKLAVTDDVMATKKSSPPVLLVHGMLDEVLPFNSMAEAKDILVKAGISVETLSCPRLGHSIDDAGIAAGAEFLKRHLA